MPTLRELPYLKLFSESFLANRKLKKCSAEAGWAYIRIMCLMHKEEQYGVYQLPDEDKITKDPITNFSVSLDFLLPSRKGEMHKALKELLAKKILMIDGDNLIQDRMIREGLLSEKRSKSGKKGGITASKNRKAAAKFAIAKPDTKPKPTVVPVDPVIDTPELVHQKTELEDYLIGHYGFKENQYQSKTKVHRFVQSQMKSKKDIDHFYDQFKSYDKYKKQTGQIVHRFDTFIGTDNEAWKNGVWNTENWEILLTNYTQNNTTNGNTVITRNGGGSRSNKKVDLTDGYGKL